MAHSGAGAIFYPEGKNGGAEIETPNGVEGMGMGSMSPGETTLPAGPGKNGFDAFKTLKNTPGGNKFSIFFIL